MCNRSKASTERGQATVALVGVIALTALLGLALAVLADAMIHRSRARTAADSVALATAASPEDADAIVSWYGRRGIEVHVDDGASVATSGPAQARAWASTEAASNQPAPVLVAVVSRAEQLLGTTFTGARLHGLRVEVNAGDGARLQTLAAELGLCPVIGEPATAGRDVFVIC